ncbi:MAG: NAD(P)/FAD-dependent oxidoreductase [Erysipelotrichaceae bacterium]|nr:NAD(P)/FAD-dependent oxidoreductase [Erysipelotrichaceae bacterium]
MYDVVIIGGGVIGCATAYYLSFYNIRTVLLERDNDVANGTTKANSAIIHAGYDPEPGTLMAVHNVEGARLTEDLCCKLDVPYRKCGALVVAFSDADMKTVEKLYQRGITNGVKGLSVLNGEQTHALEPQLSQEVRGALLAETSAIVSPWELCLALAETAVRNGVELKLNSEVTAIRRTEGGFEVTAGGETVKGKLIINAAGVHSDDVHELIGEKEFTIKPSRGEYYLLDKSESSRCQHTIFQCPDERGKGVLVSPTVHGNLIVGPNTESSEKDDVATVADSLDFVRNMASKSIPSIDFRENIRNFSGVRARSDRSDFILEESHSVPDFFNMAGIQSPGLSAAPSLAKEAVKWVGSKMELTEKKNTVDERKKIRIKELNREEINDLIKQNPAYGRIICRCESITEGEIMDCFKGPIPPVSIDGVKRRCNTGMGRCQGGFCGEKVASILMKQLNLSGQQILQDKQGSNIILSAAKGDNSDV